MYTSRTRGIAITAIAALSLGTLVACSTETDSTGTDATGSQYDTLRIASSFDISSVGWDIYNQANEGFLGLVYERLVKVGSDGSTIEPDLAESWEIGPTSATFELKPGVEFHDGTPFTADAVVANIDAALAVPTSTAAGLLAGVTDVSALDELTVEFTYDSIVPTLLSGLSYRGLMMMEPSTIADESFKTDPVGTGPYVQDTAASVPGTSYVFTTFEGYHSLEDVGPESIEVYFIADETQAYNALTTGQVDVSFASANNSATYESAGYATKLYPALRWHLMMVDQTETFADANVRKAVCSAFPMNELNEVIWSGQGLPATQRYDEGNPAYVADVTGYPQDMDAAKEYMAAAGNPDVEFSMTYWNQYDAAYQLIREAWAEIGVTVNLIPATGAEYFGSFWDRTNVMVWNNATAEDYGMASYYMTRFAPGVQRNPFNNEPPAALAEAYAEAMQQDSLEAQAPYWQEMTRIIDEEALDCGYVDTVSGYVWDPDVIDDIPVTTWFPSTMRYLELRLN